MASSNNLKPDYGTTTLFRFSSVNSRPLNISASQTVLVVNHPYPPAGAAAMASGNTEDYFTTIDEIEATSPILFKASEVFAEMLLNPSIMEDPLNQIDGEQITPITSEDKFKLWNTIIFQINGKKDSFIISKISNLLRISEAHTEIMAYLASQEEEPSEGEGSGDGENPVNEGDLFISIIKKWMGAVISLPEDKIQIKTPTERSSNPAFTPKQKRLLKANQEKAIAINNIEVYRHTLNHWEKAEKEYSAQNANALEEYISNYQVQLNQYLETLDPETGEYTGTLPTYNFTFPPLDTTWVNEQNCFSGLTDIIVGETNSGQFCGDLSKFRDYLKEQINTQQRIAEQLVPIFQEQQLQFEGHDIVIDNSPPHNSILASLTKVKPSDEKATLIITQFCKNSSSFISELNASLSINDASINNAFFEVLHKSEDFITIAVFHNEIAELNDVYSVSGEANTDDGYNPINFNFNLKYNQQVFLQISEYTAIQGAQALSLDGEPGNQDVQLFGIKKLGILEYQRVEQKVCCYIAGEVANIENIMARERRRKMTEERELNEVIDEQSEEREDEKTTDVSTSDRYDMHKEIAETLAKEQSMQKSLAVGSTFSAEYAKIQLGLSANFGLNTSTSQSSTSNYNQAENFAKDVTQKATDRMLRKITSKRTSKILREFKQTNDHDFDNRNGKTHVTGIYRWVDKIFENTIYNYGKRLIYEFMIPEPSKNFKYWLSNNPAPATKKPLPPIYPGSWIGKKTDFKWQDISHENYANIAAHYGVEVPAYKAETIFVGLEVADSTTTMFNASADNKEGDRAKTPLLKKETNIEIPEHYMAQKVMLEGSCRKFPGIEKDGGGKEWPRNGQDFITISIGNQYLWERGNGALRFGSGSNKWQWIDDHTGKVPVSVNAVNISGYQFNVTVECTLEWKYRDTWKQQVYMAIMKKYTEQLAAYNSQMQAMKDPEPIKPDYNFNPGKGRAIEVRELKRLCIETMTLPFGFPISVDGQYFDFTSCNYGHVVSNEQAKRDHARMIDFFETAFEWHIMSYEYLPYFYASRHDWETLIKQKSSSDPLFEAFLQSGMAKVYVTVRPNYEKAVMYFLDTGVIPPTDDFAPAEKSRLYGAVSSALVVNEKVPVGKPWQTRVPTDMVILQSDASPLNQSGLPCGCKPTEDAASGLAEGSSLMEPYGSDVGEIIYDVKQAVIEISNNIASHINASETTAPPTPPV